MALYLKQSRADGPPLYLSSCIDSGGMSVAWTSQRHADIYQDVATAESMATRVRERYPHEQVNVVDE